MEAATTTIESPLESLCGAVLDRIGEDEDLLDAARAKKLDGQLSSHPLVRIYAKALELDVHRGTLSHSHPYLEPSEISGVKNARDSAVYELRLLRQFFCDNAIAYLLDRYLIDERPVIGGVRITPLDPDYLLHIREYLEECSVDRRFQPDMSGISSEPFIINNAIPPREPVSFSRRVLRGLAYISLLSGVTVGAPYCAAIEEGVVDAPKIFQSR